MNATQKIKHIATRVIGFDSIGIVEAKRLEPESVRLEAWLNKGFHGDMAYMANHFEKRIDPRLLVPDAKTIIVLTAAYSPKPHRFLGIARYAQGKDYHHVLRSKLNVLFEFILNEIGSVNGRAFVDSAPLMERALAVRAGLGWQGKNGNLINKKRGSYFFICSLVLDCKLDYDYPTLTNHCGTCTACIDACPTRAIVEPAVVDATKCIAYLTIEHKREFTEVEKKHTQTKWIFGCDICQEVCPWNKFAKAPAFTEFFSSFPNATHAEIQLMTSSLFKKTFGDTAIFRTGLRRLKRNILATQGNGTKDK